MGDQQPPLAQILVVDDDPANCDLLEVMLAPAGYALQTASGGLPALQAIRRARPDLVLLDFMMPGMSGLEVLATVRKDAETADLPVILITAASHLDADESRQVLAADDVLRKPLSAAHVIERVDSLIQLRRAQAACAQSLERVQGLDRARYVHRQQVLGRFGVLPEVPAPHAASTILLVMADTAARTYYEALLVECGYGVRVARDAAEARGAAHGTDLAVVALTSPAEVAALAQLAEAHRGLPVIALAGRLDPVLLARILALDIECVLAGLPPAVLLAAIRRAGRQAASRGAEVFLSARIRELEQRLSITD